MKTNKVKTKSRRCTVRTVSFITAIIIALGIWGICSTVRANSLERQLTVTQQRALSELSSYMESISVNLEKGIYANTSPMLAGVSSTVWRESTAAKSALSQLPANHTELLNTYKFLSQVGEYTMSLNKKAARGDSITADDTESLFALKDVANKLNEQINYLVLEQQQGNLSFSEASENLLSNSEEQQIGFNTALTDTEQTISEYPTLIYDGPYSDHINKKEPEMTKGVELVSQEKAQRAAAEYLNIEAKRLSAAGEENSTLPCWLFTYGTLTVAITKHGGFPCYVINPAYAGEAKYSQREAADKALEFLTQHGFDDMRESYYSTNDGICTINFAYEQDGVICYTDLIKVSVSLDTCSVLSFDARGFIMNHKMRKLNSSTKYSIEAAQHRISPNLTVRSSRRAVIPTQYETEVYCYEYYCSGKNGEELLVYINPETGNEEDILILLYSDGGVLTK